MRHSYELGQEQFDALLIFFSPDRDEAGEKYEQIRRGLVRFFHFKGCSDPDGLADETINRVASKLNSFDRERDIKPASYFYGFAANVLMEYRRKKFKEEELSENMHASAETDRGHKEKETACLEKCLEELPAADKELVVEYYSRERRERVELRRQLCAKLNCQASALYTRIFRIKASVRACIQACLGKGS